MPLEGAVRDGVNRDLRHLADGDVRDIGFVDFDLGLDDRHVSQCQQHRAGVVHGADDRGFAFLDVASGDDAVDGRLDAHLAQVVAGALEGGPLLAETGGLRIDLLRAFTQPRFGRLHVVFCLVERLAGCELLAPEVALARQVLLGLVQLYARGFHRLALLVERTLRSLQRRIAAVHPGAERLGVDLEQELAARDPVTFVHRQVDDPSGRIGADVDEALRLNLAGGRDDGFQIAQADGFDRDRWSGRLPEVVTRAGRRSTEDDDRQHDEDLLVHATLQENGDVRTNRRTGSLLSWD